jgi:hypothetical protein
MKSSNDVVEEIDEYVTLLDAFTTAPKPSALKHFTASAAVPP